MLEIREFTQRRKISFSTYDLHRQRMARAQQEKLNDKYPAEANSAINLITFDLLAVLSTPCSNVSALFYLRKLAVYNLTIYEQVAPYDVYCFLWDEAEGKRGSTEIATCLYKRVSTLNVETTNQKFLESGHTYMMYDSFACTCG